MHAITICHAKIAIFNDEAANAELGLSVVYKRHSLASQNNYGSYCAYCTSIRHLEGKDS